MHTTPMRFVPNAVDSSSLATAYSWVKVGRACSAAPACVGVLVGGAHYPAAQNVTSTGATICHQVGGEAFPADLYIEYVLAAGTVPRR